MKNALLINKIQYAVKTKGPGRKAPGLLVTGAQRTATGSAYLSMRTLPISRTPAPGSGPQRPFCSTLIFSITAIELKFEERRTVWEGWT